MAKSDRKYNLNTFLGTDPKVAAPTTPPAVPSVSAPAAATAGPPTDEGGPTPGSLERPALTVTPDPPPLTAIAATPGRSTPSRRSPALTSPTPRTTPPPPVDHGEGDIAAPRRRGRKSRGNGPKMFLGLKVDPVVDNLFRRVAVAKGLNNSELGELAIASVIEDYIRQYGDPPPLPEAQDSPNDSWTTRASATLNRIINRQQG